MKKGDEIKTPLGLFKVRSVNGDMAKGRWETGILAGRDACCSKRALLGQALEPRGRSAKSLSQQGNSGS